MNPTRSYVYIGGNGYVYAIHTDDGTVAWEVELKPGWFKSGSSFVSLMEDGPVLYAFAYGTFYRIRKDSGEIECIGPGIPRLKHTAGVFSVDPDASTGGSVILGSDGHDGHDGGGGDGGGDGGGGGGD